MTENYKLIVDNSCTKFVPKDLPHNIYDLVDKNQINSEWEKILRETKEEIGKVKSSSNFREIDLAIPFFTKAYLFSCEILKFSHEVSLNIANSITLKEKNIDLLKIFMDMKNV